MCQSTPFFQSIAVVNKALLHYIITQPFHLDSPQKNINGSMTNPHVLALFPEVNQFWAEKQKDL